MATGQSPNGNAKFRKTSVLFLGNFNELSFSLLSNPESLNSHFFTDFGDFQFISLYWVFKNPGFSVLLPSKKKYLSENNFISADPRTNSFGIKKWLAKHFYLMSQEM